MKLRTVALSSLVLATPALADEGMWTFNNFPSAEVKKKYGFEPTKEWLDQVRLASVRIAGGCSASLVSADGLVMTNHHCARTCIENLSGLQKKDFNRDGFFAKTLADEPKCPAMEMNQLVEITDVTRRVQDATKNVAGDKFADAQKAEIAKIEKECATSDEFRCDVVTLYRGGKYDLYKYRRFQDVRLVMAPEDQIAFFGGDPDNFMFPRYDLDMTFVRIYGTDGKPLKNDTYFKWSAAGAKEGDLTFVSGNPGGTSRGLTVSQLEDDRDYRLPQRLFRLSEIRGLITEYQNRGPEQKRHSNDTLFGVENAFKALKGRHGALADSGFYGKLKANEDDFRKKVNANPKLKKEFGAVWDEIAAVTKKANAMRKEYGALEGGPYSDLFGKARTLVRYAEESGKPNGERLKEFTDSRLPQLKAQMLSNAPVYKELEIAKLTWSLTKIREDLSPDHPMVKKMLGQKSPAEVAKALVDGTKLDQLAAPEPGKDPKTGKPLPATPDTFSRSALFNGGKAVIDASKDPMIEFARSFDAEARAIRTKFENEVEGPLKKQQELLAKARFAVYGQSIYPDATFTLRLSYGSVKGYQEDGRQVKPLTTMAGAFERHTGADPFALPKTWLAAKSKLALDTPFNMATTNDIIGGNSGSPMVNKDREVVGLIFDGNIQSLGGDYGFDETQNRAVAVHSAAILEALEKIYGAQRIVDELKGKPAATGAGQP
ncbi:MAG: S46 family peptidase [Archangium sp.]|nr:S46 family peptidase [Archangium sp.]